jgi:hypothetical protein
VEYKPVDPTVPVPTDNQDVKQPSIDSFTASAAEVDSGATVDLNYVVADAESVSITTDNGTQVLPSSTVLAGQAFSRPLTADTTFILTANNKDKSSSKNVQVKIKVVEALKHATILTFDGPASVDQGNQATLIWRATDASEGVIKAGEMTVLTIATTDLAMGAYMVGPSADTVYTIAMKGTDGQEVTMTRLITVTMGGMGSITARQLFDRNVAPILQAKCMACHQGAAPDATGPKWMGATSANWYGMITGDVGGETRFVTAVPENSLLLLKGEHAGPAFCNTTNTNSAGLNHNCSPTTEEQSVTAWLLKESQERFGNTMPPPPPPTTMDYTPRTASEALTRFGACMSLTDWNNTYAQSNQTMVARQNTTQGPCLACHATGTGGAYLSGNSDDTFQENRTRPFVLKMVANAAPNPDGTFNPALLPSYRFRDKASGDGTHPNYVLSSERAQAIDQFVSLTMARYNDFTQSCAAPATPPPGP